jgi:hypothetical protein
MLNLTILHTNDIHERVEQLARIASFVKQIRSEVEEGGGYCLYLDTGDSDSKKSDSKWLPLCQNSWKITLPGIPLFKHQKTVERQS